MKIELTWIRCLFMGHYWRQFKLDSCTTCRVCDYCGKKQRQVAKWETYR